MRLTPFLACAALLAGVLAAPPVTAAHAATTRYEAETSPAICTGTIDSPGSPAMARRQPVDSVFTHNRRAVAHAVDGPVGVVSRVQPCLRASRTSTLSPTPLPRVKRR